MHVDKDMTMKHRSRSATVSRYKSTYDEVEQEC